jgi:kumamolisin
MPTRPPWLGLLVALSACQASDAVFVHGILASVGSTYVDLGPAEPGGGVRMMVGLPLRRADELDATLRDLYDPDSPRFRRYLSASELQTRHAPSDDDLAVVTAWLRTAGIDVPRVATNHLLIEATGTATQFERATGASLHLYARQDDSTALRYALIGEPHAPRAVVATGFQLVSADLPFMPGTQTGDDGTVRTTAPTAGFTVAQIAHAYQLDRLANDGGGTTIGVIASADFRRSDAQSFWQGQGIQRADPEVRLTMEASGRFASETTRDVEWAGGLAPSARLVVYEGPDTSDTSLVFTFNEAVSRAEATVLTDSFAHNESSMTPPLRHQFDAAARMAAALGITIVAASGDSALADVPATSPWVTSVGGTELVLDPTGEVAGETAWANGGCGQSTTFAAPDWQRLAQPGDWRTTNDLALDAGRPYAYRAAQKWQTDTGTTFAAPVFAAMVARMDAARLGPALGWLNGLLYRTPGARAAFRDVTGGGGACLAGPGWDAATGWGAPLADQLAAALP